MKPILLVFFIMVGGVVNLSRAQGPFEFTVHMDSPYTSSIGHGIFALTDHLLAFDVTTAYGFSVAEIRGPGSDELAPLVFDLQYPVCIAPPPLPTTGGTHGGESGCYFSGSFELSDHQITQLLGGQWYAWAHSPSAPSRPLSGQIVPEPSTIAIAFLAGLAALVGLRRS